MNSKVIQARVPQEIYAQASAVIKATGLSISDVVRVLMTRIARDKAVPLDIFQPNAETLEAINDSRQGRMERTSIEEIAALIAQERAAHDSSANA